MELAEGLWYLDEPMEVNGNWQPAFNNPRSRGPLSPIEFVYYVNMLEYAVRNVHVDLTELGVRLSTMEVTANVINAADGGA